MATGNTQRHVRSDFDRMCAEAADLLIRAKLAPIENAMLDAITAAGREPTEDDLAAITVSVAAEAEAVEDPFWLLKADGITAGDARKITFEDAGRMILARAREGKSLQQIQQECRVGAKKAGRS